MIKWTVNLPPINNAIFRVCKYIHLHCTMFIDLWRGTPFTLAWLIADRTIASYIKVCIYICTGLTTWKILHPALSQNGWKYSYLYPSTLPLSFLSGNTYLPVSFPISTLLPLWKNLSACLLPYFHSPFSLEIPICLSPSLLPLFYLSRNTYLPVAFPNIFPLSFLSGNTYLQVSFPYFHSPFSVTVNHPTTLFSAYSDFLRLLFLLFLHVPLQNFV